MGPDLKFDYEACLDTNKYNRKDLLELREWLQLQDGQSNIPRDMHDKQLLLFYNAGQMVIDDTKKCIKAYYSIRDSTPEHFDNRDCDLPNMKICTEAMLVLNVRFVCTS